MKRSSAVCKQREYGSYPGPWTDPFIGSCYPKKMVIRFEPPGKPVKKLAEDYTCSWFLKRARDS
jgi:hypothetical protein